MFWLNVGWIMMGTIWQSRDWKSSKYDGDQCLSFLLYLTCCFTSLAAPDLERPLLLPSCQLCNRIWTDLEHSEAPSSGYFDCFCMYKCRPCSSQLQMQAFKQSQSYPIMAPITCYSWPALQLRHSRAIKLLSTALNHAHEAVRTICCYEFSG